MLISDATGSGYAAKVNSDNRLAVEASNLSGGASAARKGACYISTTGVTSETLTVNATGGVMLFIDNTSTTESIVIDRVTISSDNVKLLYKETVGMTVGTIAQANDGAAISTQTSSSKVAPVEISAWDGSSGNAISGLSAGSDITVAYATTGITVFDHDGSTVISPGSNFAVGLKNASGGTLKAITSIRYYVATI